METPDTRDLTDRQLLLSIHEHVKRINGRVNEHHLDLYGDPNRRIDGTVPLSRENRDRLDQYDDIRNRVIGVGVGLGLIAGGIGGAIFQIIR